MTGLILHCKNFSFKDIKNSTKPSGINNVIDDRQLSQGVYKNKVVILSSIEEADTEEVVEEASAYITDIINQWHHGNSDVLVLPFAHLSSTIAQPPKSKELIDELVQRFQAKDNNVELITFGSHKEWMVDVYGYPRATSWFQFPRAK